MTTINHSIGSKPAMKSGGHKSSFVGAKDVHFVVNAPTHRLKCFTSGGVMKYMIEAHCEGANGSYDNVKGSTPPGLYKCGKPEMIPYNDPQSVSLGPWYVDLIEMQNQERSRGRAGVGVHGGGRGLANPFAARQGWIATYGCVRLQNVDLERLVQTVKSVQNHGGTAWLSVHY